MTTESKMVEYNRIINDPICQQIINRFIIQHPELGIKNKDEVYAVVLKYINVDLKIDEYSPYIEDWRIRKGFVTGRENTPEKLLLIVTEISEAAESDRKGDDIGLQEELADTFIRLMDYTSSMKYRMNDLIRVKMACNEFRPSKHGKRY